MEYEVSRLRKQIAENRANYTRELRAIKNNPRLSLQGKREEAAKLYEAALKRHKELFGLLENAKARALQQAREAALVSQGLTGSQKTEATALVAQLLTAEASHVRALWRAAATTNDPVTQTAVRLVAAERRDLRDLLREVADAGAWQRYADLLFEQTDAGAKLELNLAERTPPPHPRMEGLG